MRLIMLSGLVLAVAYFRVASGQKFVSRVRSVSATPAPTSTYGTCIKSAPSKTTPAVPAEEFASLLQLATLLSKAQSPPPPPPPPPAPVTPANNALNTGGIIDKLIDALIITATQKNQPAPVPEPTSGRLIDVDVLKSLLSLQGSSSSTSSQAASVLASEPTQALATPATVLPTSSTLPLTTSSSAPASSVLLEDASSIVGGNSADSVESLSGALRTLLNPEQKY